MTFALIIFGLIGLWLGTKWIINGALGIAKRFNLSHSFVGVAILAVGTDLPEVFVSAKASIMQLQGIESSGIITGNAIGSCISQITLILGVAGLFLKFKMETRDLVRDGSALVSSLILLFIFGLDGEITRFEGTVMLILYVAYYIVLIKTQTSHDDDDSDGADYSNSKLALYLISGLVILVGSSHLVVENAMLLAEKWGVAQSFVGIAIIGLGTSLPELAVSVGAALNKSAGMSVGNIIGSNIFDGLIPIGLGATISTIKIEQNLLMMDVLILLAVTLLVLFFLSTKKGISKLEGIIMIVMFVLYLLLKFHSM